MSDHAAVTAAQIAVRIKKVVAEQLFLEDEEVTNEASWEDLSADSLDVDLIFSAIEKEFDCSISEEDEKKINTVGQAIDYFCARLDIQT